MRLASLARHHRCACRARPPHAVPSLRLLGRATSATTRSSGRGFGRVRVRAIAAPGPRDARARRVSRRRRPDHAPAPRPERTGWLSSPLARGLRHAGLSHAARLGRHPVLQRRASREPRGARRALAAQTLTDHEVIVVLRRLRRRAAPSTRAPRAPAARCWSCVDDDSAIARPGAAREARRRARRRSRHRHGRRLGPDARRRRPGSSAARRASSRASTSRSSTGSPTATSPATAAPPSRSRVFRAVGGEREDIVRGLDPDLRQRLRQRRLPRGAGARRRGLPSAAADAAALPPHLRAQRPRLGPLAGPPPRRSVFETDEAARDRRASSPRRPLALPPPALSRSASCWAVLTPAPLRALAYPAYALGLRARAVAVACARREAAPRHEAPLAHRRLAAHRGRHRHAVARGLARALARRGHADGGRPGPPRRSAAGARTTASASSASRGYDLGRAAVVPFAARGLRRDRAATTRSWR